MKNFFYLLAALIFLTSCSSDKGKEKIVGEWGIEDLSVKHSESELDQEGLEAGKRNMTFRFNEDGTFNANFFTIDGQGIWEYKPDLGGTPAAMIYLDKGDTSLIYINQILEDKLNIEIPNPKMAFELTLVRASTDSIAN